uniref:glutaminase n=1 Tax=Scophthalmus maximus TaxID=52904 RepID=A0A8D3C6Y7_SCOMX
MHCVRALRLPNSAQLITTNADAARKTLIVAPARRLSSEATAASRRRAPTHLCSRGSSSLHSSRDVQSKPPSSGVKDMLFYTITEGKEQVPISHFTSALKRTGLYPSDPRLKGCMENIRQAVKESAGEAMMDRDLFHRCVGGNIVLLIQAFRNKFIIPEFDVFAHKINEIYNRVQHQTDGKVADYIPQLAKFSPELWGVSLCTVDGQRHSVGDTKLPFCLQSCVKPLQYAIAVHEAGTESVHHYVGKEPINFRYRKLSFSTSPHNPMVNAGAIVISSLIKRCCKYVGFSNATFQSEKETGDRNFAIGYYMKEKKCFPPGADMIDALDFYFQVGLPAKSGVSGAILLVIPNVMGVMCWSPPLDRVGNSVRGISFCQELVSLFNFHNYDNLRHFVKKQDPRRQDRDDRNKSVFNLMFAACSGDVSALRRFALSSMDMDLKDYDSRTALHIAAAEGHVDAVMFLTETCKVNPFVKDRWGNLPVDDAVQFGHDEVVKVLNDYQQVCSQREMQDAAADSQKLDTIEGFV